MTGNIDLAILQMVNGSESSFLDGLMVTLTSAAISGTMRMSEDMPARGVMSFPIF